MNFQLTKYQFVFRVIDALRVPPYMGNTLRGGFGHVFKQVVCIAKENECQDCMLRYNCVYSYIFETPRPQNSPVLSKLQDAPRPYVIEPPHDGKTDYQPGEELRFGLVLIGQRAMDYLPYFVFAFDELSRRGIGLSQNKNEGRKRGRCRLEAIYNLYDQNQKQIFYGEQKILTDESHPITFSSLVKEDGRAITRAHLSFLTPAAVKSNGIFLKQLPFSAFIQNLIGRTSMLALFHCDSSLDLDFPSILQRAKSIGVENNSLNWRTWARFSGRQRKRMEWGGLVGELDFTGELGEFLPYIRLGEYVHIGNKTAFGLGQYKLVL